MNHYGRHLFGACAPFSEVYKEVKPLLTIHFPHTLFNLYT